MNEKSRACDCCNAKTEKAEEERTDNRELKIIFISAALFVLSFLVPRYVPAEMAALLPISARALLFGITLLAAGGSVFLAALRNMGRGAFFDEHFLMTAASIAAFAIGEYPEAVAVMLFYRVGEYFQAYALGKSRRSIRALSALRSDHARLIKDGGITVTPAEYIIPGDVIEVLPGERVPLDGEVLEGESYLDTSALTGESVPRKAYAGLEVLAGNANISGRLVMRVTNKVGDSAVARILRLVENASAKKAKPERFITRFAIVYTPLVTSAALLLALIPPLFFSGTWSEWIRRGTMFLVVSCPCALVISVPLGFFGGIGAASRQGILVKGSRYLELLARTETVVFDKTGTLTKGVFTVQAIHPAYAPEMPGTVEDPAQNSARLLALAAHAEHLSTHPISASLRQAHLHDVADAACCEAARIGMADAQEISGKGISCTLEGKAILAGNLSLLREAGVDVGVPSTECAVRDGGTVVHLAEGGRYAGHIVIADEVKEDAGRTIAALKAAGIKRTVMLTGDTLAAGQKTAAELGVDEVYAELLPAEKVTQVERLLADPARKGSLLFLGDGINDAPVLARSDVGIAMGAMGSDAAVEAADAVIMRDEPYCLVAGITIARHTMAVVRENIAFSLGIKAAVMGLGAFGIGTLWLAVFADVGVTFLAVLNSLRLLAPGRGQVKPFKLT